MEPGELLTRWTVRLAMILYVLALSTWIMSRRRASWLRTARLAWTIGCGIFLAHVICAFAFYHHWSHAAAYEETANRTAELVGISWGGGLYLNYAFTLLWIADVIFWWRNLNRFRFRAIQIAIQLFLAFIAFNATVVFGTGMIRWLGIGATLFLLVLIWRRK
ncbi:MAG TPA: hypothetical protein VKE98_18560 [Gemmataceae bacterium]|nr:hypothetical protein [Gemmataceae bacterium]